MSHLPDAVRQGLEAARLAALRRSSRLCVHSGADVHRVLRMWDGGLALAATGAPPVRGHVELYDGPRHLSSCLIVLTEEATGERVYEFKAVTPVAGGPAADFERAEVVPAALIPPF